MDNHTPAQRDWDELKRLGYEPEVIELQTVAKSMIGFLAFVTVCIVAAGGAFWLVNKEAFATPNPANAFAKKAPEPPNPLLQTNITTKTDIMQMRQGERKAMESYGQVDPEHVRIPIDRAIDLSVEKNLIPSKSDDKMVMQKTQ